MTSGCPVGQLVRAAGFGPRVLLSWGCSDAPWLKGSVLSRPDGRSRSCSWSRRRWERFLEDWQSPAPNPEGLLSWLLSGSRLCKYSERPGQKRASSINLKFHILLPNGLFSCFNNRLWTSLAVQWLKLHTSPAGGEAWIPNWGTKIPHATRHGQNTHTLIVTQSIDKVKRVICWSWCKPPNHNSCHRAA